MSRVLVLGTHNRKKLGELVGLLSPLGLELKTLADFPNAITVDETGRTFQANAQLKATVQARHLKQWVLGEDSGLSVDALNGDPGVDSAIYAGEPRDDERNNDKLLAALTSVPLEKRTAHYTCHAALSDPDGNVLIDVEDYCQGRIRKERFGVGGFGYDPMFEVVEYGQTFGQLPADVKARISHRAKATAKLVAAIGDLIARGGWPG
jgi:XTP/dITP diphosphohydrolase